MAREIIPICDFIFGSIQTELLTDMVYIELTIRTVKGIYMYRKDHTAESMVFSPWCRTVIPFPSLHRKIQVYQDEINRCQHGTRDMLYPTFLLIPNPNVDAPQERPGLDGLTRGIGSIL